MAKQTPTIDELNDASPLPAVINNIIYEYIGNPFIFTLKVNNENAKVKIPKIKASNNFLIDWGDNTSSYKFKYMENSIHKYNCNGEYVVHLYGDITKISFIEVSELFEISQWGNLRLTDGKKSFMGCKNLTITARDSPNLQYIEDISNMFSNCSSLTADVSEWDVSNIICMSDMFYGCEKFNSDLSNWNVNNVKDMTRMFCGCRIFNSDLNNWNVGRVERMIDMFYNCELFNSDINDWNISNVIHMFGIFYGCNSFTYNLNKWFIMGINKEYLYEKQYI